MVDILRIADNISPVKKIESIKIFGHESETIPCFTIIIPTFKRAHQLMEAIESALKQDFNNYNIIVCDNNPDRNDETETMMQSYRNNRKVSYYKHSRNIGMTGNWNKGILLSEADKVVLLHDDDIMYPNALTTFHKALQYMDTDWSLLKPNLDRFNDINTIKIEIDKTKSIYPLHTIHFIRSCAVEAPTCILLNKEKYFRIGGAGPDRYPCVDYEMSLKLAYYGKAYRMKGSALGGYRIGVNASLSDETMDKYFIQRSIISKQLMKFMKFPSSLINMLDSIFEQSSLIGAKEYYNMIDYELKKNNSKKEYPKFLSKVVSKIYAYLIGGLNKTAEKKIII